ncbi:ABC transporter ATP-binding protein [Methanothrix harundinacea]|jgi:ABC-2 type transport system ATP-binding protein|uniref:ABC transporter, ATP-binding protein n=1 Tax=Methanothrix harundinacea (strain 6Ac) TaxID=1110509 RepID=G7WPD5_METH6|nr:ATP-binding cassette domain-containing protein [Methanothrix harundinacea]AET64976.1 ABC transporter, ATP-binding protein [Methanothrix harundinacea 6Ac]
MRPAILADKLTKDYAGRRVVSRLDLRVEKGELFGFLGPNGAGKTTTMRMLTTLTKPTSGKVEINGFDVAADGRNIKASFGIVQQHLSLNRELTVRENLELHARLHHIGRRERKERIDELLDYVEMTEKQDQLIDRISEGMKRRTMIARALIHRPKLIFLDEPTVGLDAQTRRRVWDLIRAMNSDGATVFLTTHYIEEAEALCKRVGIIHQGNMIALGRPEDLCRDVGSIAVEARRKGGETSYLYFPDRPSAAEYVQTQSQDFGNIVIRESNLEDVFIELTGRKVVGG